MYFAFLFALFSTVLVYSMLSYLIIIFTGVLDR